ncbi:MAG: apolipoprotein N-acyltransferase [Ignavibacteriales bacterium]|nr:apolipoprotein N-acyltransferase [Ignavibacteriales bacterium]
MSIKIKIALTLIFGICLGIAYPPFQFGWLAFVVFIPFLIGIDNSKTFRETFFFSFIAFFIFSIITLYWVGAFHIHKDIYLLITGVALLIVCPLWFSILISLHYFIKKQFGRNISLITFPFIWVGWEYILTRLEIGFPWLSLGHTQSYDLAAVQFASFTGVYGVSFWIISINIISFYFLSKILNKEWLWFSLKSLLFILMILIIYFIPKFYGYTILKNNSEVYDGKYEKIKIGVIQPNINSYEKWFGDLDKQINILQHLSNQAASENVDLILWPETAVPKYLLFPANYDIYNRIKNQVDSININLFTGVTDWTLYKDISMAPRSSKYTEGGQRYDVFNSAVLLEPHNEVIQKYDKMLLVPFAERIPWAEELSFLNLDFIRWNFGTSGYGKGVDTTVFVFCPKNMADVKFSVMICFESVFPEFVSRFVQKGSQFLVVLTNDNWWGRTSGPYQHLQFDIFRAIENRRWLVRCNNGGISSFIDPFGRMISFTDIGEATILVNSVELRNEITYFTAHGDMLGRGCWYIFLFLFAISCISLIINRRKRDRGSISAGR